MYWIILIAVGTVVLLKEISEHAVVRIYDNQGRMLYEKKTQGGNKMGSPGRYLLRHKIDQ